MHTKRVSSRSVFSIRMSFSYAKLITEFASFSVICKVSLCLVAEKKKCNVSLSAAKKQDLSCRTMNGD